MNNSNKMKVSYTCEKCGYNTNRKSNYLYHINRKIPCVKSVVDEPNISKENPNISSENPIISRENPIISQENPIISRENPSISRENPSILHDNQTCMNKNQCSKCNQVFSTNSNLNKHLKKCNGCARLQCPTCRVIFKTPQAKYYHKNNIQCVPPPPPPEPSQITNNTTNNNTTNNNNNTTNNNTTNNNNINNNTINNIHQHIHINAFGSENYDYLLGENEKLKKIIENKDAFMQKMIKLVHFNEDHPENHNIMMTNLQSKYVMVHNGSKFIKALKDDTFDKMIKDKRQFIVSNLEDIGLSEECERELRDKLLRLKLNPDKQKVLKDKVELLCYNEKDLLQSEY